MAGPGAGENGGAGSSAVQTSVEECPGQQSLQPPAARMEVRLSPEWPPEQVPAIATTAGPAPRRAVTPSQYLLPTRSAAAVLRKYQWHRRCPLWQRQGRGAL